MANPGDAKHRQFTEEDIRVLATVAKLKRFGRTYQEIHEAIEKGETADLDTSSLVLGSNGRELALQEQITDLERQLNEAKAASTIDRTASAVDRALREQAEQRAAALEREVRDLREEIGGLKARIKPD